MSLLSGLSASECELLFSLPYRAGVYVSYADDVDGENDDEQEMHALEEAIKAVAAAHPDDAFVNESFKETLRLKFEWPRWEKKALSVVEDAKAASGLVHQKFGQDAAKSYGAAVMEVAASVARAYGEFDRFDEGHKQDKSALSALVGKIVGGLSGKTTDAADHPMNISAAEDAALFELASALKFNA